MPYLNETHEAKRSKESIDWNENPSHFLGVCSLQQQRTLSEQGLWSYSELRSLESILWLRLSLGRPVVNAVQPPEQSSKSNEPSGEYGTVCGDSQVMPGTQCGDCHHGNHISPSHMSASEGRHCCPCQNPSFGNAEKTIPVWGPSLTK